MSYCPKCGNKIDESMAFCPRCGAIKGRNLLAGRFNVKFPNSARIQVSAQT